MTPNNPIRITAVTLADRAGKSFPMHAHAQGYARWKSGSVSIEEESARAIVAKVRGEQTRSVRLEDADGRLLVQCTCPARTFERPGCKHVWATLLEIDRRGALAGLRGARSPLAVSFLEAPPEPPAPTPAPTPTGAPAKKPAKDAKKKISRATESAADRASRRSPRATAAPPAGRGKPRRSPPRSSAQRR